MRPVRVEVVLVLAASGAGREAFEGMRLVAGPELHHVLAGRLVLAVMVVPELAGALPVRPSGPPR